MKLKITSDGTPQGTKVHDMAGHDLTPHFSRILINLDAKEGFVTAQLFAPCTVDVVAKAEPPQSS